MCFVTYVGLVKQSLKDDFFFNLEEDLPGFEKTKYNFHSTNCEWKKTLALAGNQKNIS